MASPLAQALAFQNSVSPAQSGIAPTDVVGAYKLASDVAEKNYQAQLAKQQAFWGGLAGLGGAGVLAFGPTAAKSFFGQGAATVAPTAAADATSAAAPAVASATGIDASAPFVASALPMGTIDATAPLASMAAPTVAADLGSTAAPTVAADLAAAAPETAAAAGGIGDALASIPAWLSALLFAA